MVPQRVVPANSRSLDQLFSQVLAKKLMCFPVGSYARRFLQDHKNPGNLCGMAMFGVVVLVALSAGAPPLENMNGEYFIQNSASFNTNFSSCERGGTRTSFQFLSLSLRSEIVVHTLSP
jgi:hypothetical protein